MTKMTGAVRHDRGCDDPRRGSGFVPRMISEKIESSLCSELTGESSFASSTSMARCSCLALLDGWSCVFSLEGSKQMPFKLPEILHNGNEFIRGDGFAIDDLP